MTKPAEFIGEKARYDKEGQIIWGVKNECLQHLLTLRGWGAIQKLFDEISDAEKFQDEVGEWIAKAINEKLKKENCKPEDLSVEIEGKPFHLEKEVFDLIHMISKERDYYSELLKKNMGTEFQRKNKIVE